jgi:F-type H+-transporting ATPase subunit c
MLAEFKNLGAGASVIALGGAAQGVGTIFGSLLVAMSRNPSLTSALFNYAILGFALTEAIALFAIMVCFLILFG